MTLGDLFICSATLFGVFCTLMVLAPERSRPNSAEADVALAVVAAIAATVAVGIALA